MSRVGRLPISIPSDVQVSVLNGSVEVQGPNGQLVLDVHPVIRVRVEDGKVLCDRSTDQKPHRALHGLTRALIANMIRGVTQGFEKKLELAGVGYRAQVQGQTLTLSLGYTNPVVYMVPPDIKATVEGTTLITVSGIDKQRVGEVAAKIRGLRPPEPYKGKGVKYVGERIRRKAGKAGAK
ncbi:MAG: 50S ribosomal protein L6 [Candidatus Methylomirabilales bacterium]|jgi:large subunit ribosomal protein L6|nr:50S ribosomal protein L6 [candidate division NC10 bacterium]